MSFILDALKKSESERQRQNGPALYEVKVAPPRSRFTVWAIALAGLLAVNGIVVGWMLLHGAPRRAASEPGTTEPVRPVAPSRPPTPLAGVVVPASASLPASQSLSVTAPEPNPQTVVPPSATPAPAAEDEDQAPAVESGRPPARPDDGGVIRATASGLPTYQDAASAPGAGLPELTLGLHDYSSKPGQSFVDLNSKILHEGETLPDGVQVEKITPDGVILSYRGTRFVLYSERQ